MLILFCSSYTPLKKSGMVIFFINGNRQQEGHNPVSFFTDGENHRTAVTAGKIGYSVFRC
jgi:hypothetical protein